MSNELMPGIPNLPGDETVWEAFVDQFETLKKGDRPISLTNWDSSSNKPAVMAGSAIEIAGATYRFPSNTVIQNESGVAAGTVYVVIKTNDPDASSATPYFTNIAPEWRGDLNGLYDTTGANRYTGHLMEWDGSSAYTAKRYIENNQDALMVHEESHIYTFSVAGSNPVENIDGSHEFTFSGFPLSISFISGQQIINNLETCGINITGAAISGNKITVNYKYTKPSAGTAEYTVFVNAYI